MDPAIEAFEMLASKGVTLPGTLGIDLFSPHLPCDRLFLCDLVGLGGVTGAQPPELPDLSNVL
jgi:hypothetical protein